MADSDHAIQVPRWHDLNLAMFDAYDIARAKSWARQYSGDVRTWVIVAISLLLYWYFFLGPTTDPARFEAAPDFVADGESPETKAVREGLLGAWELVSYEIKLRGAINYSSHPLGPRASGLLIYTPDGHMSVQMQRPGARVFRSVSPHWGFWWEKSAAMSHYMAYGGTFRVGRLSGNGPPVVEHGVQHSLYPNWVGGGQVRLCQMEDGDRLVLRPHTLPKVLVSRERIERMRHEMKGLLITRQGYASRSSVDVEKVSKVYVMIGWIGEDGADGRAARGSPCRSVDTVFRTQYDNNTPAASVLFCPSPLEASIAT